MNSDSLESIITDPVDIDQTIPAIHARPFPQAEDTHPFYTLAAAATRHPYGWGILGSLVPLGRYIFLGMPDVPLEIADTMLWFAKELSWPIGGLVGSSAVHELLMRFKVRQYPDILSTFEDAGYRKTTTLERIASAKDHMLAQTAALKGDYESARSRSLRSIESDPRNLAARFGLAELAYNGRDFESALKGCYEAVKVLQSFGCLRRNAMRIRRATIWSTLHDRYLKASVLHPKDLMPKVMLASAQAITGFDEKSLDTVEDIMTLYRKGHHESHEIDVYSYLASVCRAVGHQSRNQRSRAKVWETWLWEQSYLLAFQQRKDEIHFGESKNKVYSFDAAQKNDIIIKEFPSMEDARGALRVNAEKQKILSRKNKYFPLHPVALFSMKAEGTERTVSIWRMLPGETFYQKIRSGDPDVLASKDKILDMMGLLHKRLDPDEFGLKQRDPASYVSSWIEKAGIDGLLGHEELSAYYAPITASYANCKQVFSLDPHPMNFQILNDGRIATLDDEVTRKTSVQSDLARFIELFPYDPYYHSMPGTPAYRPFIEDVERYAAALGDLKIDDAFHLGYLNAVIDLGLSLYAPYSVRSSMGGFKRHLLLKSEKAIDIIKHDFQAYYTRHQEEYQGLLTLASMMFVRNGFDR